MNKNFEVAICTFKRIIFSTLCYYSTKLFIFSAAPSSTSACEYLPSTMCGNPDKSSGLSLASAAKPDFLTSTQRFSYASSDSSTNFTFSPRSDRLTSHSARSSDSTTLSKWPPVPASDRPTLDSSSSRSPSNSSSRSSRLEDSETPRSSGYSTFSYASSPSRLDSNGGIARSRSFCHPVNFGKESSVASPSATTCQPEPPAITIIISDADIVPTNSKY